MRLGPIGSNLKAVFPSASSTEILTDAPKTHIARAHHTHYPHSFVSTSLLQKTLKTTPC